jgi:quinoprotein glucose dehydrogenase
MRRFTRSLLFILLAAVLLVLAAVSTRAQKGALNGEWRSYGGDVGNTRYSPLDQINASNFYKLEVGWRFSTRNLGPTPETNLESTPLVANGVFYSTAGTRRYVIALNAATGEMLWQYREDEGQRGTVAPRQLSGRGLAYWTDGTEERIIYVTPGYRMIALNAKTGQRVTSFGQNGVVDLKTGNDQEIDLMSREIGLHAAPVIARNTIVVGAAHRPGGLPTSKTNVKGYVRGFDVKTGQRKWIFHTIPRPGEFGLETWLDDSWSYTGNTGVWGQISIDEELGLVYLGVETPTGDFYGGPRPGAGLYGESIVAVDLETGVRKWHYQYIHHGIWDQDNPCPPILVDVPINGRIVKVVAQPTKQAFLYVLNRETGQPIWPIEERPVEKGTVPGEWYSPTQPFPTKPPAYDRQGVSVNELIDFTPALREEAIKIVANYKMGPMFTPPVESKEEGPWATLTMATAGGGSNWPGGSVDPETGIVYVSSQASISGISVIPSGTRSDVGYVSGRAPGIGGRGGLTVQGLPLAKPPYGQISAIDLKTGDILWQTPHGETPDNVRNHPALKGLNIPRTGRTGTAGSLVTKTLVVAGEKGTFTLPDGRVGAMLRAYDKANGREVGAVYMPMQQTGGPMTYLVNGVQYIVVAVGGQGGAEFISFKLPNAEIRR